MVEVLTLRLEKWLRVGAGFGLLLLLAAQEKVCPWALRPPCRPAPAAETQDATSDQQESSHQPASKKKSKKKCLPYLLPDATAPRWPAAWNQVTLRRTTGARDGIVSCGQRDPAQASAPIAQRACDDRWAWHCFLRPVEPCGIIDRLFVFVTPQDPAVRTSISPTGPPSA